jgi:NADH dehydrogenase [ubiquinone] 1 alpha subcomplex assembly factor 5
MVQEIFNPQRRILIRKRRNQSRPADQWILKRMEDDVIDRLHDVVAPLKTALVIGQPSQSFADTLVTKGIALTVCDIAVCDIESPSVDFVCAEDRLPFEENGFDAVFSCGVLDTVNDLPGALILIHRVLKPGGLFMGACMGAGSIPTLKAIMLNEGAVARTHPQIDVRSAGDLLSRGGFTMPLADHDEVTARYRSLKSLANDLRANGLSNALQAVQSLRPSPALREALSSDQQFDERFSIIYLTGWKAAAGEPRANGPIKSLF